MSGEKYPKRPSPSKAFRSDHNRWRTSLKKMPPVLSCRGGESLRCAGPNLRSNEEVRLHVCVFSEVAGEIGVRTLQISDAGRSGYRWRPWSRHSSSDAHDRMQFDAARGPSCLPMREVVESRSTDRDRLPDEPT